MLNDKYRPRKFEDVLGQETTKEILQNIVKSRNLRPLLFIGGSGVGKTTLARIFAKELKGEIYELDASTNGGVNDVRNIINEAKLKSLTSDLKVFLIDECHCLSSSAWSSFLLELEEKRKHVLYIFLTTEEHKIPETILSRLVMFRFHKISETMIENYLKEVSEKEEIKIQEMALRQLAKGSKGNVRLALNYLEKAQMLNRYVTELDTLNIIQEKGRTFINEFINGDIFKQKAYLEHLEEEGYELSRFIGQCINYLLDYCMSTKYTPLLDLYIKIKNELKDEDFKKEIILGNLLTFKTRS